MLARRRLMPLIAIGMVVVLVCGAQLLYAPTTSARQGQPGFLPIIFHLEETPGIGPNDPFTFLSWADTRKGTSTLAALSEQAKTQHPALTIYPGDLEDDGFTRHQADEWKRALNGNVNNGMYDITFPLRGNHDYENIAGWQNYFDVAGTAARIGAIHFSALSEDLTYSFEYGNSVFVGVDTPAAITAITPAQIAFLDLALTDAESRGLAHAFLFFHSPIYAVSKYSPCPARVCPTPASVVDLIKMLNKHPIVSATFHGHDHLQSYVHLDSSRMPEIIHPFEEFIIGAAGAGIYPCDYPYRFDYCGEFHGFARIAVNGKLFTVSFFQQGETAPVQTYNFSKP